MTPREYRYHKRKRESKEDIRIYMDYKYQSIEPSPEFIQDMNGLSNLVDYLNSEREKRINSIGFNVDRLGIKAAPTLSQSFLRVYKGTRIIG